MIVMSEPPRDLQAAADALRVAELQADAAMHGETIAQAGIRRARAALNRDGRVSAAAWKSMTVHTRTILVTMNTSRHDAERAALGGWDQFSDSEQCAIGAAARQWRRELEGASWLR